MPPPKHHAKNHELIVRQFREQLIADDLLHEGDSIGTDDRTLLRFLRARHFHLKQAKAMWKNCVEWRNNLEDVGIDELYRRIDPWDYPERDHVFDCWPLWFHKTDKKGRPLNIHFFGGINMPDMYNHISPERHWQTVLVNCESLTREVLPAASQAAGKPIEGTFVIVDLKGFGLSQFWQMKSLARSSFQVSQDYFPETMAQLAIVNAPSSFTTIWSFIKPWLAKETVAKVDILGTDYQEQLLKLVDAENLPASLGGKCTCDGLGGCEKSNAGPWVVGRKERRERWLKDEGDIALGASEIEAADQSLDGKPSQDRLSGGEFVQTTKAESGDGDGGSDGESSASSSSRSSSSAYAGSDTGTHEEVLSGFTLVDGSGTARSSRESTPPLSPTNNVQGHLKKLSLEGEDTNRGQHLPSPSVVVTTS